jgi:hypothetical protein
VAPFTTRLTNRAFAALDEKGRAGLEADILDLIARTDIGKGSSVIPSEYLEAVIVKPA